MAQENEKQVVAPLDLTAIKERASKATPGPLAYKVEQAGDKGTFYAGSQPAMDFGEFGFLGDEVAGSPPSEEDIEFFEQAQVDVTALIAEVERLRNGLQAIDEVDGGSFTESYNLVISIAAGLLEGKSYDDLLKDDDETDAK